MDDEKLAASEWREWAYTVLKSEAPEGFEPSEAEVNRLTEKWWVRQVQRERERLRPGPFRWWSPL